MSFSIFATSETALAVREKPLDTKICSDGLRGKLRTLGSFCHSCLNAHAQSVQCVLQVLTLKLARNCVCLFSPTDPECVPWHFEEDVQGDDSLCLSRLAVAAVAKYSLS